MKNVLFAASECTPFIKTGGLADVIGSLPQALKAGNHAHVQVILPLYEAIPEEYKKELSHVATFQVPVGWRNQQAHLLKLEHDAITYYFIANDYYFARGGTYGYHDDGERFIFFSRAIIEAFPYLEVAVDILHCHDWQTGLAVAFAKTIPPTPNLQTVFTIHNIQYQGYMPHTAFGDLISIPIEHFPGFEWQGMINCMKAGLFHADKITTVSPSYAEEIKQPYYSEGLHPILHERDADIVGVINGIDTNEYNPMKDPHIEVPFKTSRKKKQENKTLLQEELGLDVDADKPLFVAISRLVEQKGFHLLEHIMEDFLQEDVQVIILGTGDQAFEHSFSYFAGKYPRKMATILRFSEAMARKLYASADFFLMPSKFEPCGLSQLISLQYKTVPIVRETGGLKDTVTPFNQDTGEGNGFSFANYNAHELLHTMHYALSIYHDSKQWKQLLKNVNKSQFSWKDSASSYADIYRSLI
ncbi:glycogen synthase GlgA [Paenalkalicoccus suaedae]|uniref:Glycogen synthase n=1 Tax=Paenalkalicoccus suaedae TaxID=2592382 RepID=A0A859FIN4_9BACI|nr:glycogen synthase GlgA [Paenalkalicoccus suaedae]QKS72105.1 glycogen synthase GlgA [Paenalkalicoccus suaedae]